MGGVGTHLARIQMLKVTEYTGYVHIIINVITTMDNKEKQLTEYEKYCRMMAQQQEDEMDETIMEDELKEYQPEGVFVRGH